MVADILANPANYHVNVHTAELPAGAFRGQLVNVHDHAMTDACAPPTTDM